jgi:hypothetical protein
VLGSGAHSHSPHPPVEHIVPAATPRLPHPLALDLAGARILATLGEAAVKAQAYDAIAALVRRQNGGAERG